MAQKIATPNANGHSGVVPKAAEKSRLPQSDIPTVSLDEALRVPLAIRDNYACNPMPPIDLAQAMELMPASSRFRSLCGAAVAYGLVDGSYTKERIGITGRARRIIDDEDNTARLQARREAIMLPRVIREFLDRFNRHRLPRREIGLRVLAEMGVPEGSADRALDLTMQAAESVGYLKTIKGSLWVDVQGAMDGPGSDPTAERFGSEEPDDEPMLGGLWPKASGSHAAAQDARIGGGENKRVFVTHGKNRGFLDPLKELLLFGELEPIVAVERESVSEPVPDKVMADMRACSAAIIHVDAEQTLQDAAGQEHIVLNPNVLIEIGAAMALYGNRFILLVEQGVTLPTNLQGLYAVRYKGDTLDGETTIRLLKAIKEMKDHPLPHRE